jgi:tetratricopeptide (TPR) repeat protein
MVQRNVHSETLLSYSTVDQLVQTGAYESAVEVILNYLETPLTREARTEAEVSLSELYIILGRYQEAEELLHPLATRRYPTADTLSAYSLLLENRGQVEEAARLLGVVIEQSNGSNSAYLLRRADLFQRLGRKTASRRIYESLISQYEVATTSQPVDLAYTARAYQQLGQYIESNELYSEASSVSPDNIDNWINWASLFIDKYRPDESREVLRTVLDINPRHPHALVLSARSDWLISRDPTVATQLVEESLNVNPLLPEAYELLAEIALADEEYGRAIDILNGILLQNPTRLESLTMKAASHYLLDERRSYRHLRDRVFQINPVYAEFFSTIGDFAARSFRYSEAEALYYAALEINSGYLPAMIGLGLTLSRQGREDEALTYLSMARENDPFNAHVYHTVNLHEHVLPNYEYTTSEHFRYRFHREERPVLENYYSDIAEAAFSAYSEQYRIVPDEVISIEVFSESESFAVRSVGIPHVGPHGICFGQVITSRSPNEGTFNWAEVISHEISHVFTLTLSNARVPRWFSEGLASYDAGNLRAEWRHEDELYLLTRISTHQLLGIEHLNQSFIRSRNNAELAVAYFQSTLAVQFIIETWGQETIREMLRLFGEHERLPEVLFETTGVTLDAFNSAFNAYIESHLNALLNAFEPMNQSFEDEAFYEARVDADPDNAQVYAELAMAKFQAHKIDECTSALDHALLIDPENPLANFLAGTFAHREGLINIAESHFEHLRNAGFDGYTLRLEMAGVAALQGQVENAITHYLTAQNIYPQGIEAIRSLADIYLRSGQLEAATEQMERLVMLDQNDFSAALTLVRLMINEQDFASAWQTCNMAIQIDPFNRELHKICGQVAFSREDWENTAAEYNLYRHLGGVLTDIMLGQLERAQENLVADP